jgi:hypothetical protein
MRVKEFVIHYNRPDVIKIYAFGDIHIGTLHCYEEGVRKKVKQIQDDPLAYYVEMADSCEFITPHDPRWDSGALPEWLHPNNIAEDQTQRYCEIMSPIKHKCIGKLKGNHEDAIEKHSDVNVQQNICDRLGIDNLDASCFIRFIFKRKSSNEQHEYTGFFTHGSGCAVTPGAKLIRLQRLMDNFDADIIAHGHIHDLIIYEKPYLSVDKTNHVRHKVKVGAMTGCWFRTYTQDVASSYGEKKNFPPTMLGCPVFEIEPDKRRLSVRNG